MTDNPSHFDFIVVGQGLAGTALAWSLRWNGLRVLTIDRNADITSSKIAAGLITPVTGQKLVGTWRFPELWSAAKVFYSRVERETRSHFFRQTAAIRLFASNDELITFHRRMLSKEFTESKIRSELTLNENWISNRFGGFEMSETGIVDTPGYLAASRKYFLEDGGYLETQLDVPREIEVLPQGIRIPRLGVEASEIVFCQGAEATTNPWFRDVEWKPAKGEILLIRVPHLDEARVIHQGVWLAPLGGELFKAGSTYEWEHLDNVPTALGRNEIVARLQRFLKLPFEVIDHVAAIRPIHKNQFPVMGRHPSHPRLGMFNGLGSKGSLQAPYFADLLARWLTVGGTLDQAVDLRNKTTWKTAACGDSQEPNTSPPFHVKRLTQKSLTEQAQNAIREVVQSGDAVIDATAGNGHDTHFLAKQVGTQGTVYAFDIQQLAIENTSKRLLDAQISNVILLNHDHRDMVTHIPPQHRQRIAAVMFNLGYLPGGDKTVTTQIESTIAAIKSAVEILPPYGLMTILAYTGHDGGKQEANAVADLLDTLPRGSYCISNISGPLGRGPTPILFLVKRIGNRLDS